MTNRLVSGFEEFDSGNSENIMSAAGWYWFGPNVQLPFATTGRFGYGTCLGVNQGAPNPNTGEFVRLLGVSPATGFFGFAYKYHPSLAYTYVSFYDAVNSNAQISIAFFPLGVIKVYRGHPQAGTLLITSAGGSFTQEQWFFCEVGATVDSSAGAVEVRVNTVPVINLISANTNNTGRVAFDSVSFGFYFGPGGSQVQFYIDDLYFNDALGSVNNTFLGNVRVKTLFTSANGATNDFTIGGSVPAATNWQSVQNLGLDDSKFVYDATVGQLDLYQVQAIINSPLVHAVQVSGAYRMDDATQRNAHNLVRVGGTVYEGGDHFINQTYTYYRDVWELNPATGLGWTGADVNGAQIGVKVAG